MLNRDKSAKIRESDNMFWKAKPEFQLSIKRCEVRNHDGAESRKIYYEINEYHQMGEAYATVVSWIKDNGYKINGPMFNIYHVGPVQTQNPNEFVTETCFPVE